MKNIYPSHQSKQFRWFSQLAIICITGWLAGCGFHLRGTNTEHLALPPVQLTFVSIPTEWQKSLDSYLTKRGIQISENGQFHVILDQLNESRRVASLNSRAKAAEYEIHFSLDYRILNDKGDLLAKPQTISASRTYQFIESQVVGKEQEEQILKSQIQKLLFQKLVRHLQQLHRLNHAA